MEQQPKQINPEYVINSLGNRIADLTVESANKDAVIIQQKQQIDELKKDNENLRESLADVDSNHKETSEKSNM